MARYKKVDVRIWGDEDFRAYSDQGKTLWLYLITAPESTSVPGLFCASRLGIADALGWTMKVFDAAFAEVSKKGKVKADWKSRVVWVRNVCKYNVPESPNVIRGWAAHVDEVPECALKQEALLILASFVSDLTEAFQKAFAEAFPKAFPKAFPEGFPKALPKGSTEALVEAFGKAKGKSRVYARAPDQEQEQEQEQEQDPEVPTAVTSGPGPKDEHAAGILSESGEGKSKANPAAALTGVVLEAYDAIVADESLRPIVAHPEQLAADLVRCAPAVDVPLQVARAGAWMRANPAKAKKNGARFLTNWVNAAQERGGDPPRQVSLLPAQAKPTRPECEPMDIPKPMTRAEAAEAYEAMQQATLLLEDGGAK